MLAWLGQKLRKANVGRRKCYQFYVRTFWSVYNVCGEIMRACVEQNRLIYCRTEQNRYSNVLPVVIILQKHQEFEER
jgi:hypothetical protein